MLKPISFLEMTMFQGSLVVLEGFPRPFAFHHPIFTGCHFEEEEPEDLISEVRLCALRGHVGVRQALQNDAWHSQLAQKRGWVTMSQSCVSFSISPGPARTEYSNHQDVDTLSFCLLFVCTVRSWIT